MKESIEKFLEFNGKSIFFVQKDGKHWIAVKPICEVLGVTYNMQRERIKRDEILSQLHLNLGVVAADGKIRKMVCLPEKYIYGWLFGIQSKSNRLIEYKKECYELLFNYFNGTITRRKKVLNDRSILQTEIEALEEKLETNTDHQNWLDMKSKQRTINKSLKNMDDDLSNQQLELGLSS